MSVMDKTFQVWVESVQSAVRANPQLALSVPINRKDSITAQAIGISGIVLIMGKALLVLVKSVEPCAIGTYPEHTLLVLVNSQDEIAAQTILIAGVVLIMGKLSRVPIESLEPPSPSANPK
jgi:hypothetical protein